MNDNIILIGMPGAGKSTVGVLLAKALGYDFIDTDLIIQGRLNNRLYKIIEEHGIDYFLQTENKIVSEISADHTVIATGGSVVFGKEAMEHLRQMGKVVYIKLGCDEIKSRVNNITTRGIVMKKNETIEDIYSERVSLYERYADIMVDVGNTTIEEAVEKILSLLE
ncbi:MAG: shikimate kinase [Lachnospiraceae bacterium]|nr:shikimate kinase [Lachnospiraceae bacterium]